MKDHIFELSQLYNLSTFEIKARKNNMPERDSNPSPTNRVIKPAGSWSYREL